MIKKPRVTLLKEALSKATKQDALDIKIQEQLAQFEELGWIAVHEVFQNMVEENSSNLNPDQKKLLLLEYLGVYYQLKQDISDDGDRLLVMKVQKAVSEATTDSMTGIANRRAFNKQFETEKAVIARINSEDGRNQLYTSAIISFDVNGLKKVNDELGHNAGDEFIKCFAKIVSSSIRPTDQLFRVGGDEFIMIASGVDIDECNLIISRIREALDKKPFIYTGIEISVKTGAGIALITEDSNKLEVVDLADQELYEDKKVQPKSSWVTKGSAPAGKDILHAPSMR